MKRYLFTLAFMSVLLLSACSYLSNFVLVNESDKPINVRYRIKNSSYEPFQLISEPAKVSEPNLRNRDSQWRTLNPDEYQLDRQARTVTVQVEPHEALRLLYISNYPGHDAPSAANRFEVDEIVVNGTKGEVKIQCDEARRKFTEESESLYVLSYK